MKFFYFLFAALLLSCAKEYKKPPVFQPTDDPENLAEKLLGTWKLYEQTSVPANDWDGDGKTETDMFAIFSSCEKEAGFDLATTGNGLAKLSCNITRNINWKITNNSNDFNYQMQSTGSFQNYKIIQLNQNYFIISGSMQASNGKTYTINYRYFRR